MSSKRTDARSWNLLKHRGLALETPKSGAEDYPGNHADYGSASTAVPFEAARRFDYKSENGRDSIGTT